MQHSGDAAGSPWSFSGSLSECWPESCIPFWALSPGVAASIPWKPIAINLPSANSCRETAASENATAYFPILDRIASGHFSSVTTEAELYEAFLDVLREDDHITSPEALSTFNLALSLRTAAPRVEAHYQYYSTAVQPEVENKPDCDTWAVIDGYQHCTPTLDGSEKLLSSRV